MATSELPVAYRQVYAELKKYIASASGGGLKRQPIAVIEGFAHHYLVALSMLSRLRANPALKKFVPAYQAALLEANILLYPEESVGPGRILRFALVGLPAQLWENRWYFLLSTAICLGSALVGFLIVVQNFEMAPVFIPTGLRSNYELEAYLFSTHAQQEMLTGGRDGSYAQKAAFATFLMINNIRVALLCFTLGVLFGLPTLLMLLQTGLMLGALPALFFRGDLYGLGAWLLPHGVPEVSAILLAGGAGLKLGFALLKPAPDGLGRQFRQALLSVSGTLLVCVGLLIWAGLVESFVRQSDLSNPARYLIAAASVVPLAGLFGWAWLAHRWQIRRQAARWAPP